MATLELKKAQVLWFHVQKVFCLYRRYSFSFCLVFYLFRIVRSIVSFSSSTFACLLQRLRKCKCHVQWLIGVFIETTVGIFLPYESASTKLNISCCRIPTIGPYSQPSSSPAFDILITLRKSKHSTIAHLTSRIISYDMVTPLFRYFAISLSSVSIPIISRNYVSFYLAENHRQQEAVPHLL